MKSNISNSTKTFNNSDSYSYTIEKNSSKNIESSNNTLSPSLEDTNFTNNLISRKTYRGRKEKMPFPKNKPKCEICLQFSDMSKEELISCSICKCLFHKSCFDKYEFSQEFSYRCIRCIYAVKLNKPINDFKCFICNSSNGVIDIDINYIEGPFYHKVCLDLLIECKGLKRNEIRREIRKWRHKNSCRYCGEKLSKNKAVIKCKNPKCKEYFHIPCSIEKGLIFDLNYMKQFYNVKNNYEIPFYCSNHNKKISSMYKNYILNNNNDYINSKKIFSHFCEGCEKNEISEEKISENIKNNTDIKNNEEIINNENIKENKNNIQNEDAMNIDDSFENSKNNVFNLDFGKINQNENYNKMNDELILRRSYNTNTNNNYCNEYVELNSYFPTFN